MKIDKKTTIIIMMGLILLAGIGVYAYNIIIDDSYLQGYNQGQADIIIKINTEGVVPVMYQEGNQTKINWVSISNEQPNQN